MFEMIDVVVDFDGGVVEFVVVIEYGGVVWCDGD